MRVSTPTMSSTMNRFITQHNEKLEKINKQMMTQQRITLPSEDPIASTRLLQINREQANIKQYSSNISGLSNSLANQTGHVSAINKQLVSIKSSLVSINGNIKSNKDIAGVADELNYMLESVVAGLNAKIVKGAICLQEQKVINSLLSLTKRQINIHMLVIAITVKRALVKA